MPEIIKASHSLVTDYPLLLIMAITLPFAIFGLAFVVLEMVLPFEDGD